MEQTIQHPQQMMTPAALLKHWQGHRDLTRRVIEAFPEKEFFDFSIGGMRTFAAMTMELLGIAAPGLREIVGGKITELNEHFEHGHKKENLLKIWDQQTEEINTMWQKIPAERFQESIVLFGKYKGTVLSTIFYFIDNEIHHRGQGYVYLRTLGIEPPFFWDRK
ncbi:MAG TPA: DinB family protein [Flavobacteriaceae bacterium]|nr:DinB family protein [Flavobacteriaceae bacterium]